MKRFSQAARLRGAEKQPSENEDGTKKESLHKFSGQTHSPGQPTIRAVYPREKEYGMHGLELFRVSQEIRTAFDNKTPVVALESTIYTHGFPYPENVALALDLEKIVRKNGGIPATIGVLNGVIRVGLSSEEITALASSAGKPETMKVSRRDIPYILGMVSSRTPIPSTHACY